MEPMGPQTPNQPCRRWFPRSVPVPDRTSLCTGNSGPLYLSTTASCNPYPQGTHILIKAFEISGVWLRGILERLPTWCWFTRLRVGHWNINGISSLYPYTIASPPPNSNHEARPCPYQFRALDSRIPGCLGQGDRFPILGLGCTVPLHPKPWLVDRSVC